MTDLCQAPDLNPRKPRVKVPGATNSHLHLFGPRRATRWWMIANTRRH